MRALEDLVGMIDEPNRAKCFKAWRRWAASLEAATGSSHNHQAWPGGYLDHVAQTMAFAAELYPMLKVVAGPFYKPPFSLSDALLVLFLHDIEKPFLPPAPGLPWDKDERKAIRYKKIFDFEIQLTDAQLNALDYVEGEGKDYSRTSRTMNELAAFCHMCDVASARIFHSIGPTRPHPL